MNAPDAAAANERVNGAISMAELERRWGELRAAMARAGIDVLVAQNNNDHMGGNVKYLTDIPATNGYPITVVFPRDDDMTIVRQGPFDGVTELSHAGNGVVRGAKRLLTTPNFVTAGYTARYDSSLALEGLIPYARATIGLVGLTQMSYASVTHFKEALPEARFVDATPLVDEVRAIRSEEEIALARITARLQDTAMAATMRAVVPGMRDSDVTAIALHECQRAGAEQGIFLCASGPAGTPMRMGHRHMQNRRLREGDQFALLIETNGPGGVYVEIGRTIFLGPVPAKLEDEFGFTLEARRNILSNLVPGRPAAEVSGEYDAFMAAHGRPKEKRLVGHGQGYDMVERPLIRHDETMRIASGMNIAVHPTYVHQGAMSWICDNYLVRDGQPIERLHALPEQLHTT